MTCEPFGTANTSIIPARPWNYMLSKRDEGIWAKAVFFGLGYREGKDSPNDRL